MPFDRDLRALLKSLEKVSLSPAESLKHRLNGGADKQFESDIEMTERHVREGELRVLRQSDVVLRLRASGGDSELAEALLAQFEDILAAHRVHLMRLKR